MDKGDKKTIFELLMTQIDTNEIGWLERNLTEKHNR